ncbi:MAG: Gfo/Idh/MocA family oxidoreductase [Actinobacteria bacterium]|nr:Gfo/Idh/MocA family oxidoreductase [Actinomycetota bacterium]
MTTNQYKNIRPLVIGIGVAGKRHLEAQLNLGIKTGIYTTNPQTKKSLKGQNNIIVFDKLSDGLDWSNLVHVCTPDDRHTKFVAAALKKKKAVLCEKSFTTSLKDALYLQKLSHQYAASVFVGQNYRLTPTFLETRKKVLAGDLGAITRIETTYLHDVNEYQQRKPARRNQDFLYIGGSHAVDLACWIAGEPVISVCASATNSNPKAYQVILKFSSGLLAKIRLDASSSQIRSGSDLKVFGDKGKLVSHNKIDKLLIYKKGDRIPQSIQLPNTKTYTIALEVKVINDYLLGRNNSYWPIPDVDENINTLKILDMVEKILSNISYNK